MQLDGLEQEGEVHDHARYPAVDVNGLAGEQRNGVPVLRDHQVGVELGDELRKHVDRFAAGRRRADEAVDRQRAGRVVEELGVGKAVVLPAARQRPLQLGGGQRQAEHRRVVVHLDARVERPAEGLDVVQRAPDVDVRAARREVLPRHDAAAAEVHDQVIEVPADGDVAPEEAHADHLDVAGVADPSRNGPVGDGSAKVLDGALLGRVDLREVVVLSGPGGVGVGDVHVIAEPGRAPQVRRVQPVGCQAGERAGKGHPVAGVARGAHAARSGVQRIERIRRRGVEPVVAVGGHYVHRPVGIDVPQRDGPRPVLNDVVGGAQEEPSAIADEHRDAVADLAGCDDVQVTVVVDVAQVDRLRRVAEAQGLLLHERPVANAQQEGDVRSRIGRVGRRVVRVGHEQFELLVPVHVAQGHTRRGVPDVVVGRRAERPVADPEHDGHGVIAVEAHDQVEHAVPVQVAQGQGRRVRVAAEGRRVGEGHREGPRPVAEHDHDVVIAAVGDDDVRQAVAVQVGHGHRHRLIAHGDRDRVESDVERRLGGERAVPDPVGVGVITEEDRHVLVVVVRHQDVRHAIEVDVGELHVRGRVADVVRGRGRLERAVAVAQQQRDGVPAQHVVAVAVGYHEVDVVQAVHHAVAVVVVELREGHRRGVLAHVERDPVLKGPDAAGIHHAAQHGDCVVSPVRRDDIRVPVEVEVHELHCHRLAARGVAHPGHERPVVVAEQDRHGAQAVGDDQVRGAVAVNVGDRRVQRAVAHVHLGRVRGLEAGVEAVAARAGAKEDRGRAGADVDHGHVVHHVAVQVPERHRARVRAHEVRVLPPVARVEQPVAVSEEDRDGAVSLVDHHEVGVHVAVDVEDLRRLRRAADGVRHRHRAEGAVAVAHEDRDRVVLGVDGDQIDVIAAVDEEVAVVVVELGESEGPGRVEPGLEDAGGTAEDHGDAVVVPIGHDHVEGAVGADPARRDRDRPVIDHLLAYGVDLLGPETDEIPGEVSLTEAHRNGVVEFVGRQNVEEAVPVQVDERREVRPVPGRQLVDRPEGPVAVAGDHRDVVRLVVYADHGLPEGHDADVGHRPEVAPGIRVEREQLAAVGVDAVQDVVTVERYRRDAGAVPVDVIENSAEQRVEVLVRRQLGDARHHADLVEHAEGVLDLDQPELPSVDRVHRIGDRVQLGREAPQGRDGVKRPVIVEVQGPHVLVDPERVPQQVGVAQQGLERHRALAVGDNQPRRQPDLAQPVAQVHLVEDRAATAPSVPVAVAVDVDVAVGHAHPQVVDEVPDTVGGPQVPGTPGEVRQARQARLIGGKVRVVSGNLPEQPGRGRPDARGDVNEVQGRFRRVEPPLLVGGRAGRVGRHAHHRVAAAYVHPFDAYERIPRVRRAGRVHQLYVTTERAVPVAQPDRDVVGAGVGADNVRVSVAVDVRHQHRHGIAARGNRQDAVPRRVRRQSERPVAGAQTPRYGVVPVGSEGVQQVVPVQVRQSHVLRRLAHAIHRQGRVGLERPLALADEGGYRPVAGYHRVASVAGDNVHVAVAVHVVDGDGRRVHAHLEPVPQGVGQLVVGEDRPVVVETPVAQAQADGDRVPVLIDGHHVGVVVAVIACEVGLRDPYAARRVADCDGRPGSHGEAANAVALEYREGVKALVGHNDVQRVVAVYQPDINGGGAIADNEVPPGCEPAVALVHEDRHRSGGLVRDGHVGAELPIEVSHLQGDRAQSDLPCRLR